MIYRAVVTHNRDPRKLGRIRVVMPHIDSANKPTNWIYPLISDGFWVIPKIGDHVFVAFEAGDAEMPLWIGAVRTEPHYVDPNTEIDLKNVANLLYRILHLERRVASLEYVHNYEWEDAPYYDLGDPGVTDHPGNEPGHVHNP